jgi:hypothetical protein
MPEPPEPSGFVRGHSERRAKRDGQLASDYASVASTALPAPPPVSPPVNPKPTAGVRAVVSKASSGARLETFVGLEPRPAVDPSIAHQDRQVRQRERWAAANARHNRRGSHLLRPDLA